MPPAKRKLRRFMLDTLALFLLGVLGFAIFLYFWQGRMIYFPQAYPPEDHQSLRDVAVIEYKTSQGRQFAYYLAPAGKAEEVPEQLWVMFGGNAALAIDWLGFADSVSNSNRAFLLFDYPGYGACNGSPSRATIIESEEKVMIALANHLGVSAEELDTDINVLGYSMGAATGLEFAVQHPVKRVILLAPFTSLLDMAHGAVGWPMKYVLRDRFDSRARLRELSLRDPAPRITIIHGQKDEVVNIQMGRELSQLCPEITTFHAIDGCYHDGLLDKARGEIIEAMEQER